MELTEKLRRPASAAELAAHSDHADEDFARAWLFLTSTPKECQRRIAFARHAAAAHIWSEPDSTRAVEAAITVPEHASAAELRAEAEQMTSTRDRLQSESQRADTEIRRRGGLNVQVWSPSSKPSADLLMGIDEMEPYVLQRTTSGTSTQAPEADDGKLERSISETSATVRDDGSHS
ncbi:unnamed protein product, partial [Prorocentrum cordatum]